MIDVAIIGGGASGLVAAIVACQSGANVCLLESENKLGKKIAATGNGRCNLSNTNITHHHYNTPLVNQVFEQFSPEQTLQFFSQIGINCFADAEGRIYPLSESAKDVVQALELKLATFKNLTVMLSSEVLSIEQHKNAFFIEAKAKSITAKTVVMAAGANAARKLLPNHTFMQPVNVLTGFDCPEPFFNRLAGIRIDAKLTITKNGQTFAEVGQVQMRANGISGIVVFNASAFVAKHNLLPCKAVMSFLPNQTNLAELLSSRRLIKHLTIEHFLLGVFPKQLATVILEQSQLQTKFGLPASRLSDADILAIANTITHFEVQLLCTSGVAQVEAGGVGLNHLNVLQSKLMQGLFFSGESAHVFGTSGGYNLQWAWSSGAVAGAMAAAKGAEL